MGVIHFQNFGSKKILAIFLGVVSKLESQSLHFHKSDLRTFARKSSNIDFFIKLLLQLG